MILISYWDLLAMSSLVVLLGAVLWLNGFARVPSYCGARYGWWCNCCLWGCG